MSLESFLLGAGVGGIGGYAARVLMEPGIVAIPDEIQAIASQILFRRTWQGQETDLVLWFITSYNVGHLFGAQVLAAPRSIETLVSIAPTATPNLYSVEVSKLAFAKIDVYYAGVLLTTFPEVPASDTLNPGYYHFHVTL